MGEHNLIQRPELMLRLARRLGMRQAHITPALNPGIQGVVIVDDIRDSVPADRQPFRQQIIASMGAQALLNPWVGLYCKTRTDFAAEIPADSTSQERPLFIRRITCSSTQTGGVAAKALIIVAWERGKFAGSPALANVSLAPVGSQDTRRMAASGAVLPNAGAEGRFLNNTGFSPGATVLGPLQELLADQHFAMEWTNLIIMPGWTFWVSADTINFDMDVCIEFDQESVAPTA